jgi:hypothetical protein
MKKINELNLGYGDAENYQKRENKDLFNRIFVRDFSLDKLLYPSTYFLIGEKGTGKTAYSVFLANNEFKDTKSQIKYIRETDYQKFVSMKRDKHLQLSDYSSIWKVIIFLIMSQNIDKAEIDENPFSRGGCLKSIMKAVDKYYMKAFSPEIVNALSFVENSEITVELVAKYIKLGGGESTSVTVNESKFQVQLMYIQKQFELALSTIKLKTNRILFIDGIDIRPGDIPYQEYLECVKGLADAIWSLNNDFFAGIRDSKGRMRAVLLLRPDIFNSLGLQNSINKLKDNSVLLDWRTTYPDYRSSKIFQMSDRILKRQQDEEIEDGKSWDHYFPWVMNSTSPSRESDDSFLLFLKLSYSRPRDIISAMKILQEISLRQYTTAPDHFSKKIALGSEFTNDFSEYLMAGVKDQLSFYYNEKDYEAFYTFFSFLKGEAEFSYETYSKAYDAYTDYLINNFEEIPEFVEKNEKFLQFLYDTNIISYIETDSYGDTYFHWCYRERTLSNICPKVRIGVKYRIHYGLFKALNVGTRRMA